VCPDCNLLNHIIRITLPADLMRAIAMTREGVEKKIITEFAPSEDIQSFMDSAATGTWGDFILYHFMCKTCSQVFQLSAETYHGADGWWKPVDGIE
jgi:hypothetical protein